MMDIIETLSTFTPLGIRFWDPVLDVQVGHDLIVTANPIYSSKVKSRAYRTKSNIYAFSHLYDTHTLEYGETNADELTSPTDSHSFIVEVIDSKRRYLNIAFPVELPLSYNGIFLTQTASSPSTATPKGVYLFSAPSRTIPSSMALIRGELLNQDDNQPAAFAVLRVTAESGEIWYGISDELGRFVVMMPYPELVEGFGGSPSSAAHKTIHEQTWDLDLEIFYSPQTLESLPGTSVPDYLSVLRQDAADIWPVAENDGGTSALSLTITLEYHKPAIPRTDGYSTLFISPIETSP